MSYIKKGFQLAIGVCLGKAVYKAINTIAADLIREYVPEKYWNREHPDYLNFKLSPKEQNKQRSIGFKMD